MDLVMTRQALGSVNVIFCKLHVIRKQFAGYFLGNIRLLFFILFHF